MSDSAVRYPFTAVVGQDRLKLALILSAVSPGIGGVLIRGEKGTAKSTIVRGLGPVAGGRVVELPIGATEDRVVGSLDLTGVLREGRADFTPGLLAQADGGVLYIDEVNLLADHLVDVLLDAAASGRVTIERDGVSHTQAADFVLVGTMNPEEGELRPQLLDRFGLAVDVVAAHDVDERVQIISRRMEFDADPEAFVGRYADQEAALRTRIAAARAVVREVSLPTAQLRRIAGICAHLGVDGLRGDIVVARAAAAHAAWRGAQAVDTDDIAVAVELALPHRRRRDPFDDSGFTDEQLDEAMEAGDEAAGPEDTDPDPDSDPDDGGPDEDGPDDGGPDGGGENGREEPGDAPASGDGAPDDAGSDVPATEPESQQAPAGALLGTRTGGTPRRMRALKVAGVGDGDPGRRSRARSTRGATTHAIDFRSGRPLHLFGTVLAAAGRTAITPDDRRTPGDRGQARGLTVVGDDLRAAQRVGREGNLVVFVVDLSGSMTARRRLAAVSDLCVDLLRDSYTRRDRVAVVTARGSSAQVTVPPTRSVDLAVRRLAQVRTSGRTPLAEGLQVATEVIDGAARREPARRPLLVVLTDGRATAGPDAPRRAGAAAAGIARRGIATVVVDCEQGMIRLGMAHELAARLGAQCLSLDELTPAMLHRSGPDEPAGPAAPRRAG